MGRMEGLCTVTKLEARKHAETLYCDATAFLPAGRILLAGYLRFSEESRPAQVVIVGGTGRYAGARGFATLRDLGPSRENIELHILP